MNISVKKKIQQKIEFPTTRKKNKQIHDYQSDIQIKFL